MSLAVLWSYESYRVYALASLASLVGMWAQRVAIGWLVWESTGSVAWLGFLALADAAPIAVLGIVGGGLSDRLSPLRLARMTTVFSAISTGGLFIVVFLDEFLLPLVLVLTMLNSLASAIGQPARMVLAPSLVERSDVPAAVAFGSVSFNVARLIGPMIGGALIVQHGVASAVGFNALTYAILWLTLVWLAGGARGTGDSGRRRAPAKVLTLRDVMQLEHVRAALVLTAIVSITLRCYVDLLPGVAGLLLDGGPATLAALTSVAAAGAIVGGFWMISEQTDTVARNRMLVASAVAALAMLGLGYAHAVVVAGAFTAALGFCLVVSATASQSLIQLHAPVAVRGRAMGLYLATLRGAPAVGALAFGMVADLASLGAALATAGVTAGIALLGFGWWSSATVRRT